MDKFHLLFIPIIVRFIRLGERSFQKSRKGWNTIWSWKPNLNAIRALMYLANYTCMNISFFINLLTRYYSSPTWRHWNKVMHITLRYNKYEFVLLKISKLKLIIYAYACYFLNLHNGILQTYHLFIFGGIFLSWRFVKQPTTMIWLIHAKLLSLHEARQKYVVLRFLIQHI